MLRTKDSNNSRKSLWFGLLCLTVLCLTPALVFAQQQDQIAPPPQLQPPLQPVEMNDMDVAVLRSLDKTYARTSTFEVPVGQTVKFGETLFIRPQACRKTPPTKQPESAAFLQIWEHVLPDAAKKRPVAAVKDAAKETRWVFSGWMFASSPALSAMDHPVFDVWVIDCKKADTKAKASAPVVVSGDTSEGDSASDEEPPAPSATTSE